MNRRVITSWLYANRPIELTAQRPLRALRVGTLHCRRTSRCSRRERASGASKSFASFSRLVVQTQLPSAHAAELIVRMTPMKRHSYIQQKTRIVLVVLCLLGLGFACSASAQSVLDLETSFVIPGYNNAAIPGESGTRFSLTDDLDAEGTVAFRLRYSHTYHEKHWVAILAAPLTVKSDGTLHHNIDFNGTRFLAGTPVDATFRFDSYRLVYRYCFRASDAWQLGIGGAVKVRDAAIRLEGGGLTSEKDDVGVVPLLSFALIWTPSENLHLVVDGEALADPQGRSEDVLLAVQYDVSKRLTQEGPMSPAQHKKGFYVYVEGKYDA